MPTRSSFWKMICTGARLARTSTRSSMRAAHVIVLDHLVNPTTEQAELVLPSGTFAESDGTFVSSEGRAQRFFQVFVPHGDIQESWRWLGQIPGTSLDEVLAAMATALPQLAPAARCGAVGRLRDGRGESSARVAPIERPHGDAGQHQRLGAQAAG